MDARTLAQLLRPSAISGLVRLRARLLDEPGLPMETACKILAATYDGAGMDIQSACALHGLIAPEIVERRELYRQVIRLVAVHASPPWCALLRTGREALYVADPDVLTCFQRAGAFDPIPSPQILEWWDELASLAYADVDIDRMVLGRRAERLSLQYEQYRLSEHLNAPEVIWKSLDSNAAGYDLQSWDSSEGCWSPKYIEVKGTMRSPPCLHMTRHEWNTAIRHHAAYSFQIWDLGRSRMAEVSVEQMALHVPTDNGQGTWDEATIYLPEVAFVHVLNQ